MGQIVVFGLNNQKYALPIEKVSEIIRLMEITEVPNMEYYYKGIINLRGKVIPVMSLHLRMGMRESDFSKESRIIVAEGNTEKIGLIVDNVYSISQYTEEEIEYYSDSLSDGEQHFITGVIHQDDDMVLLVDFYSLLGQQVEIS